MASISAGYASYGIFAFGLLMLVATIVFSSQTALACQFDSAICDMIGIHPTRSSIEGVVPPGTGGPLRGGGLIWNDGCNERGSPFLLPVLGVIGTVTGLRFIIWDVHTQYLSN